MAISTKKAYERIFRTHPEKGKRRSQRKHHAWSKNPCRYLSKTEREIVLDICKILSLRLAIIAIDKTIAKLGGFKARSLWGDAKERIYDLYDERSKLRAELKFSQKKSNKADINNHNSPHYAAKVLQIDVALVYRVLRKYAWTRSILFGRDKSVSESPTLNQAGHVSTSAYRNRRNASYFSEQEAQRACNRADLCTAPQVVASKLAPPQQKRIKIVPDVVSLTLHFKAQYALFLSEYDPPDEELGEECTKDVDSYFRVEEQEDVLPYYKPKKRSFYVRKGCRRKIDIEHSNTYLDLIARLDRL